MKNLEFKICILYQKMFHKGKGEGKDDRDQKQSHTWHVDWPADKLHLQCTSLCLL